MKITNSKHLKFFYKLQFFPFICITKWNNGNGKTVSLYLIDLWMYTLFPPPYPRCTPNFQFNFLHSQRKFGNIIITVGHSQSVSHSPWFEKVFSLLIYLIFYFTGLNQRTFNSYCLYFIALSYEWSHKYNFVGYVYKFSAFGNSLQFIRCDFERCLVWFQDY